MKNEKKKFVIKDWHYFAGPLALVSFLLMDVIGGYNFPGYSWTGHLIEDLLSINSHSFAFALVFCIIYFLLTVFAVNCICKYFKSTKFNKTIKRGVNLFLIASVIFALGLTVFVQPESGTYKKIKEDAVIATKTEVVDSDSDATETQEVFDADTTMQNFQNAIDDASNPFIIGNLFCSLVSGLLAIVALIFIIVGGFKKSGNMIFATVAIFCCVLLLYSIVANIVMDTDVFGLNSRFASYSIVLFTAFLSSYIYITDVKE